MIDEAEFNKRSNDYETSLSPEYKKQNGVFYTDLFLAGMMLDEVSISRKDIKIIDISCGTGSFILSAINKGYTNVYGLDTDKGALKIARAFCPGAKIEYCDTLANKASGILKILNLNEKFDVVIGNPPYAPLTKESVINTDDSMFLKTVKSSGDNLFIAALLRAMELVKDGGIISYIIPKNFLHINSYSSLRREILRSFSVISIVDIGSYFKNVRGEQIILTIMKSVNKDNVIHIKKLINNEFQPMADIRQDFYMDEIILFYSQEDFAIYRRFQKSFRTLNDYVTGYIGRGRSKSANAVSGKDIRKFGLKDNRKFTEGNQVFIQNIYSTESGIIACFGGNAEAGETVTVFTDGDSAMCRYVLGIIHSRLCNFYLYKYCFNNSRLTMHVDAKYLKKIPFTIDKNSFETILKIVSMLENEEYMSEKWFNYYELLNKEVYKIYNVNAEEMNYIETQMKKIQSRKWAV